VAVMGGVALVEFSVIDSIDRPDSSTLISASMPVCSSSNVHVGSSQILSCFWWQFSPYDAH